MSGALSNTKFLFSIRLIFLVLIFIFYLETGVAYSDELSLSVVSNVTSSDGLYSYVSIAMSGLSSGSYCINLYRYCLDSATRTWKLCPVGSFSFPAFSDPFTVKVISGAYYVAYFRSCSDSYHNEHYLSFKAAPAEPPYRVFLYIHPSGPGYSVYLDSDANDEVDNRVFLGPGWHSFISASHILIYKYYGTQRLCALRYDVRNYVLYGVSYLVFNGPHPEDNRNLYFVPAASCPAPYEYMLGANIEPYIEVNDHKYISTGIKSSGGSRSQTGSRKFGVGGYEILID